MWASNIISVVFCMYGKLGALDFIASYYCQKEPSVLLSENPRVRRYSSVINFWTTWGYRGEVSNMAVVASPNIGYPLSCPGYVNEGSKTGHHSSVTFYLAHNAVPGLPP